ncbi:MAG: hypothetical protein QOH87_714, partial [Trebonia sp.]|nr:hypothetical protein [Trebonia sp.]
MSNYLKSAPQTAEDAARREEVRET